MTKHIALLLLMLNVPLNTFAFASLVYDPSNYIQNGISAKNSISSLISQSKQLEYQIEALRYQVDNSRTLGKYQWREIANLLTQANQITQQGQSISYSMSNLDSQFRKYYPNYAQEKQTMNYQDAYSNWNQSTMTTFQNSLQSIGFVANDLAQEERVITNLKQQSMGASGQLQALQVINQANTESVHQLQSLKQIIAAQTNSQTAYMAQQVSQDSYEEQAVSQLINSMPTQFPQYRENGDLGKLPIQ